MKKDTEKLNAVEKALKILQIQKNYEEGLGTDEISKELNFTMQTVSRLLNDLSRNGLFWKNRWERSIS